MRKLLIPAVTAFLFAWSCTSHVEPIPPPVSMPEADSSLIIGDPFKLGYANLLLFPVGGNYTPTLVKGRRILDLRNKKNTVKSLYFASNEAGFFYDGYAEKEFINSDESAYDIRNILFYDMKTGMTSSLTEDTIHILSFALHFEFGRPMIFYRAVHSDFNNDSLYSSEDAVELYISDIHGRNLVQVTPADEQFVDYTVYPAAGKILIKTRIDSNNDSIFDDLDETNFREMKLRNPHFAREIFSSTLKDVLRGQIRTKERNTK